MYWYSKALQSCVDWFKTDSFPCSPTAHMSELFVAVLYTVYKWDSVCDIGAASFRSIGIKITHRLLTHHLSTASNYSCFMVMFIIQVHFL
jgi:hypothetical protein